LRSVETGMVLAAAWTLGTLKNGHLDAEANWRRTARRGADISKLVAGISVSS
jgi:hypothetical protein